MAGAVAYVREGFFPRPKAPWMWLRAGVVDGAEDEAEDEEHSYIQGLSDGWRVAQKQW